MNGARCVCGGGEGGRGGREGYGLEYTESRESVPLWFEMG